MVRISVVAAVAALLSASFTFAQNNIPTCGPGRKCPESAPCCSAYGQCGVGAYCLGGCDPLFSHSLDSCIPAPVCKSADYKLDSLDDIQPITRYLGDASKANWVASGNPVVYNNEAILLTMAPDTVGTLLSSTHYVWYGRISATMTTSQGAGVVTAFITMSDVKDEIDFEFVGVDLDTAQTNYYSQGVTNYNNGMNLSVSNTVQNVHTFTIDWKPDSISWIIDGKVMRTKERKETWNSTANRFDFPQTPARVMLSLWPAGLPSNAKGTVDWAGGLVDWNSPYMQNGYYYAMFSNVKVECYQPPAGAQIQGSKAYIDTDERGTNDTVRIIDDLKVLKSMYATGENPNYDPNGSKSSTGSSPSPSSQPETIPGISGAGERGQQQDTQESTGGTATESGAGSAATGGSGGSGFSQGSGSLGSSGAAKVEGRAVVGGSVFAVVVALIGLLVL